MHFIPAAKLCLACLLVVRALRAVWQGLRIAISVHWLPAGADPLPLPYVAVPQSSRAAAACRASSSMAR